MPGHEKRIEIRWRDMDNFGHVNNAVYLTYLEEARDEHIERVLAGAGDANEFFLGSLSIRYRKPLTQADEQVVATCRVSKLGRSTVETRETLATVDGTVAAEAEAVLVAVDRSTAEARPLTAAERAALERAMDTAPPVERPAT
jgi:acyl-CoA thioester hydrolase